MFSMLSAVGQAEAPATVSCYSVLLEKMQANKAEKDRRSKADKPKFTPADKRLMKQAATVLAEKKPSPSLKVGE